MPVSSDLYFATSNQHKYGEARYILRGSRIRLHRLPSKGTEIQSDDVSEIAACAASEAYAKHRLPVFVEDTMLSVKSLRGFPGAYASYVNGTIGPEGVLRLLEGRGDRTAEFSSAVAFVGGRKIAKVFVGRLPGTIAMAPKGHRGFGFDPIFIPAGERRTLAEMTLAEKCAISHRSRAIRAFASWYLAKQTGQPL